jgi:TonB family protein
MRLASFFIISLALHTVALVQPLSFSGWRHEPPIAVTILPIESDGSVASGSAGNGMRAPSNSRNPKVQTLVTPASETAAPEVSESSPLSSPVEVIAKSSETEVVLAASTARSESAFTVGGGSGAAGNGGNGSGSAATGSGFGNGDISSQSAALLTQARYRETPKPAYPEVARREGHEGRVLLRVLIDDQGKTKSIEINRSSGSDALDQAATEAIKRWRFHPARAGDKPVESWVSIPIEFQLKDSRN